MPLQPRQDAGYAFKVRPAEKMPAIVPFAAVIGRIKVKQGMGPVVPHDKVRIVQALDRHPGQPVVQVFQRRNQLCDIKAAEVCRIHPKAMADDLAAEACLQEIEESGRAFKIGQRLRVGFDQALEFGAGGHLIADDVDKGRIMALQDAEEIRDVPAIVVDYFCFGAPCAPQKDAPIPTKGSA